MWPVVKYHEIQIIARRFSDALNLDSARLFREQDKIRIDFSSLPRHVDIHLNDKFVHAANGSARFYFENIHEDLTAAIHDCIENYKQCVCSGNPMQ
jgi:hypothetical protein